ncbi:hypothetical protein EPO14_00300 [Patescibacteria group bacterium]|nr:MAG: hypothetical protein EPO14_00300 [Patescibacteria group bacterium]
MTYFLDFDRTLFDTSAFLAYILERDNLGGLLSLSEVEMATELNSLTAKGLLVFAPGELDRFMYADANDFLRKNHDNSAIVTAGNVELQKAKLESVFHDDPSFPIFYNGDERKGTFIARMLTSYQEPLIFIDDKISELDSVALHCPQVQLYEMRRDGKAGAGTHTVIHSFNELS